MNGLLAQFRYRLRGLLKRPRFDVPLAGALLLLGLIGLSAILLTSFRLLDGVVDGGSGLGRVLLGIQRCLQALLLLTFGPATGKLRCQLPAKQLPPCEAR